MAAGRASKAQVVFNSDDLIPFIEELRRNDFHIGVDQFIAAENLLILLTTQGRLPDDPQRLCSLLAPILCTSANEQEIFYERFNKRFIQPIGNQSIIGRIAAPFDNKHRSARRNDRGNSRPYLKFHALLVFVASISIVITVATTLLITQNVPATAPPANSNTNAQNNVPKPATALDIFSRYIPYAGGLLLLFLAALWMAKTNQRRLQLMRWRTPLSDESFQIIVKSATRQIYRGADFRSASQTLRRHRANLSNELNITSTVEATARNGGWFMPVYSQRKLTPEYLLLIDRLSFSDQQAHLGDELFKRLDEDGIIVDRYFFHGNPHLCYSENPDQPPVELNHLATLHPDHSLIVFSDCASFTNSLARKPQRWLDLFSPWARRALLTPKSPEEWGYLESLLANLGFMILPAKQAGLAAFAQNLNGNASDIKLKRRNREFPRMLKDRAERWLNEVEPDPMTVNTLIFQLRLFLGSTRFYWFSACAVYPKIIWELTLYLGDRLVAPEEFEEGLSDLVRLPWFRQGVMPDWLRLRLISALPPGQERNVRKALDDLLKSHLDSPRRGFGLDIFTNWLTDKASAQHDIEADSDAPLDDNVFLDFMSGRKVSKLALMVPAELGRLFQPPKESIGDLRLRNALVRITLLINLLSSIGVMHITGQGTQGWGLVFSEFIVIAWIGFSNLALLQLLDSGSEKSGIFVKAFQSPLKRLSPFVSRYFRLPRFARKNAAIFEQSQISQEAAPLNPARRLIGMVLSPRRTFADIDRRPTFLVPMILGILIVTGVAFFIDWWVNPNWENIVRAQLRNRAATSGVAMPSEQVIQAQANFTRQLGKILPAIFSPTINLILAVIFALVLRLIQAQTKFKKILSVVSWSNCATGLAQSILLMAALMVQDSATLSNIDLTKGINFIPTNPAAFLPANTSSPVVTIASSLDIFSIWFLILLTIGFTATAGSPKMTSRRIGLLVFEFYALWILIKIGFAVLSA